jgi:hypothetical protein
MAHSREAATRLRIQAIAQDVPGLNAQRIVLGLVDLADEDGFFRDLGTSDPFLVIHPAEQTAFSAGSRLSSFDVECLLYFGFPADQDYDFTAVEDIVFALRDALADDANWTDAPYPTGGLKISKPELAKLKPVVGLYRLTLSFLGA